MGDLGFDDFVRLVFDHEDPEWMWGEHEVWKLEDDPANVVDCLSRVFEDTGVVYPRFTSEQVAVGVNYLINPSMSNMAFCLLDASVSLADRLRSLRSIEPLYAKFFAKVLPNEFTNGSSKSRASNVCYMFWDVIPFHGRTTNPYTKDDSDVVARWDEHLQTERTCIDVLEETLAIEHLACQEGALHGLGHWQSHDPARIAGIVDEYLETDRPQAPADRLCEASAKWKRALDFYRSDLMFRYDTAPWSPWRPIIPFSAFAK